MKWWHLISMQVCWDSDELFLMNCSAILPHFKKPNNLLAINENNSNYFKCTLILVISDTKLILYAFSHGYLLIKVCILNFSFAHSIQQMSVYSQHKVMPNIYLSPVLTESWLHRPAFKWTTCLLFMIQIGKEVYLALSHHCGLPFMKPEPSIWSFTHSVKLLTLWERLNCKFICIGILLSWCGQRYLSVI